MIQNNLGIIINDCDYDYLYRSKDSLRRRYIKISFVLLITEGALVIVSTVTDSKSSILVNMILGFCFLFYNLFEKPYFDTNILQFSVTINIFTSLAKGGLLIAEQLPNNYPHFLSQYLLVIIPFSYGIGREIVSREK